MNTERHKRADELRKKIEEKKEVLEIVGNYLGSTQSVGLYHRNYNDLVLPVAIAKTALVLLSDHISGELAELQKEYDAL